MATVSPQQILENRAAAPPSPSPYEPPVPLSLPPLKKRDLNAETHEERLKMDLAILKGQIHSDLVVTMDKRRLLTTLRDKEREKYLEELAVEEAGLWKKLQAVELLLA